MSNESTEVLLARLEERLLSQAETQKEVLQQMRDQATRMVAMDQRMQNVETSLTSHKPVIEDFITIKHKVVGAGQFGKWVWVVAASAVTFVLTSREKLFVWLSGN